MKRKVEVTLTLEVEVSKGGWREIARVAREACRVEINVGSINLSRGVISTVKGPTKIPTVKILD